MKARAAVLLALLLLSLTGCNRTPSETVWEHDGLTLTLPGDFSDLSGESFADGCTFFYGSPQMSLLGMKTGRQYLPNFTLAEYASLILKKNPVEAELSTREELYFFEYKSQVDSAGTVYGYIAVFYETETDFWAVQAFCPEENLETLRPQIWRIFQSIQTNERLRQPA